MAVATEGTNGSVDNNFAPQTDKQVFHLNPLASSFTPAPLHTLFVSNLGVQVTDRLLEEAFAKVVPVFSARVCRDCVTGAPLGHGYVNFPTSQAAQEALEALNCTKLFGYPIHVAPYSPEPSTRRRCDGNLVVMNFNKELSERDIYEKFRKFGLVLSCKIPSRSASLAFVQFNAKEDADKALSELNGKPWHGKTLEINRYVRKPKSGDLRLRGIFINNLPKEITEQRLSSVLSAFDGFIRLKIVQDGTSELGYAVANFQDFNSCSLALANLIEHGVDGVAVDASYVRCMAMQIRVAKAMCQEYDLCKEVARNLRRPEATEGAQASADNNHRRNRINGYHMVVQNLPRDSTTESVQTFFRSLSLAVPDRVGIVAANAEKIKAVVSFDRRDDHLKAMRIINQKAKEAEDKAVAEASKPATEDAAAAPVAEADAEAAKPAAENAEAAGTTAAPRRRRGRFTNAPFAKQLVVSGSRHIERFVRRYEGVNQAENQNGESAAAASVEAAAAAAATVPPAGRAPSGAYPSGNVFYSPVSNNAFSGHPYMVNDGFVYVPMVPGEMFPMCLPANTVPGANGGDRRPQQGGRNGIRSGRNNYNNYNRHYNNNNNRQGQADGHRRNNRNVGRGNPEGASAAASASASAAAAAVPAVAAAAQAVAEPAVAPVAAAEAAPAPVEVAAAVDNQELLSAADLAAMNDQQQKEALGNLLYYKVQSMSADMTQDLAQKITGMFMDLDTSELLLMLENPSALIQKVSEAVNVLEEDSSYFSETNKKPTLPTPEVAK